MENVTYRLTTNPGLEDIVAQELSERLSTVAPAMQIEMKPRGLAGVVLLYPFGVSGPAIGGDGGDREYDAFGTTPSGSSTEDAEARRQVESALMGMRSVFHVIRHLRSERISRTDTLDEILEIVEETSFPEIRSEDTFRVTSKRSGSHGFRSTDIEREAGAVVNRMTGMKVDLEHFSVHVRVDLSDHVCTVGLQLTRVGLDRRYSWEFRPRVALRTVVAYAMLRLARLHSAPRVVLDPFCGSGTVLLEAAALYPEARLVGSDKVTECVEGARANIRAAWPAGRIEVFEADARDLAERWPAGSVDAVICNPPFGVRLGLKTDFMQLYTKFLRGVAHVLPAGGRAVFLGGKRRHHVGHIIQRIPELHLVHVRVIETGGVYPAIYVLERTHHAVDDRPGVS
ncbi:MAG: THUMP domain-containing protein [Spirochaetota bacterium]